jgi:muramoyltetrapeptide carboxypeptidase
MDFISLVSPSYISSKEELKKSKENLKKIGINKIEDLTIQKKFFDKWAGNPKERLEKLKEALNSKSKAIVFTKGGSGSLHFIPNLKIKNKKRRKIVMGYSDITPLLLFLSKKKKILAFHGPNMSKRLDKLTKNSIEKALKIEDYGINIKDYKNQKSTKIKGKTIGGNLVRTIELLKYKKINLKNKIIFLELTNSTEHKIFNLLMDLKNQKSFKPRAILFGNLGIKNKKLMCEMISYLFPEIPLIFDLPFGHQEPNIPIPLETTCEINFKKERIRFIFSKKQKKFAINLEE